MTAARERIADEVATWTFQQPLLSAAFHLHELIENPSIASVRTGARRIEFNADFIASLDDRMLSELLRFEMVRVALGHPYQRRRSDADLSFIASNVTVQECLHSTLPIPSAAEMFDDAEMSGLYFEQYYRELLQRRSHDDPDDEDDGGGNVESDSDESSESDNQPEDASDAAPLQSSLESHLQSAAAAENVELWREDDLLIEQLNLAIEQADSDSTWGSITAGGQQRLRARLNVRLDYARVLRQFRRSMSAPRRTLTRMRANRRYGLQQMGSRYDSEIGLLLAVDVSGSMSVTQIERGLSIVHRMFRHGVCQVELVQFDNRILGSAMRLRSSRGSFSVGGRSGTDFQCVLDFAAKARRYDGVIVYTDGCAATPRWPSHLPPSRRPPLVWLLSDRERHDAAAADLRAVGRTTYVS